MRAPPCEAIARWCERALPFPIGALWAAYWRAVGDVLEAIVG